MVSRSGDIRTFLIFYGLIHAALLVVLGVGGSGLEDSGVQLALAALAVISTVFTLGHVDDGMQDLYASWMDIPEDDLGEHMRGRRDGFNLAAFRLVSLLVFGLILVAELLAIY